MYVDKINIVGKNIGKYPFAQFSYQIRSEKAAGMNRGHFLIRLLHTNKILCNM